ncbi:MAG TPA: DUF937 domain-containing protein [Propionibacteriaceae bacterium]|jgi:hypothetical protein|nr:DUF937 domain-containing protein [Propionibacteriaceae bacterium]
MSATDEILANIPLNQLAAQLGVDEATAEAATRQAIPALLGGLQANAQDPAGAASLAGALGNHSSALVDGGVNLDEVDTADGEKIVGNIFGSNSSQVAHTLGHNLGQQSGLIQKLLPILAPIVLSYLTRRLTGGGSGGGAGDLLGSILGGSGAGQGGGLSDVLGGMLGGGQAGGADRGSGSVLDMLGGMLGGGRR